MGPCGETDLGHLVVSDGQRLNQKAKPQPAPNANVGELAHTVDNVLRDGVGTVNEFVRGIFLTGDHMFWQRKCLFGPSRSQLATNLRTCNAGRAYQRVS